MADLKSVVAEKLPLTMGETIALAKEYGVRVVDVVLTESELRTGLVVAGVDEVGGKSAALKGELAEFQHAAVYHELDKALFICHLFFLQCPRA